MNARALAQVLIVTCRLVERARRPVRSPFAEARELVGLGLLRLAYLEVESPWPCDVEAFEPTDTGWRLFEATRGVSC